jgi:hypothetical protein
MPEFTVVLKDALERKPDSLTRDQFMGLDTYPIFDTAYRTQLNNKIVDHFQFREIGLETVEMFRVFIRRTMNERMPIYNQFYKSQTLTIDPFITFDTETDTTNNSISLATNSSLANAKARAVNQDFPQTMLSENGDYASDAVNNVSDSTSSGEADSTDESSGTVNTRGFSGSMSDLLLRYRDTFLNIDMQVIAELDGCFMGLWSNNDETFPHRYGYIGWGF